MEIRKYKTLFNEERLPQLVCEINEEYELSNVDSPKSIAKIMTDVFKHHLETEEIMYMACLNTKNEIIGIFEISHGTVNNSSVNPREIFMKALICGAVRIIVAHNHPSGNSEPSKQDIIFSKRVSEAGDILGIEVMDSLIITEKSFVSLKQRQLF